jgi:AraC-like DNA-binding protein
VPAATLVSSVSTEGVAAGDRLAFWEHYNAQALVGLTCSTYADEGLLARQVNLELDGLRIADIAGNAHVIERAPGLVRDQPKDATFLTVLLEGEAFFYSAGGCVQLRAGDLLVYETDRPYLFGFGTAMRQVLVDVPRALFAERCGGGDLSRPVKVSGHGADPASLSARALRSRLLGLVDDPAHSAATARDELLELMRTALDRTGTAAGTGRLLAAKEFIGAHLQDPALSTDRVARAVGVSTRHLNRAFAIEGTTVAQYVQGRRLDSARVDLAAVGMGGVRIADIACRWGFASQAHFTRLFRARFGCTPSEVRPPRAGAGRREVTGG